MPFYNDEEAYMGGAMGVLVPEEYGVLVPDPQWGVLVPDPQWGDMGVLVPEEYDDYGVMVAEELNGSDDYGQRRMIGRPMIRPPRVKPMRPGCYRKVITVCPRPGRRRRMRDPRRYYHY